MDAAGFDFGHALAVLKSGNRVARAGWNGKGMFLFLVPGSTFKVNRPPLLGIYPEGTEIEYHAHIDMKTAQGYVVPWLASQADMLAEDWHAVSGPGDNHPDDLGRYDWVDWKGGDRPVSMDTRVDVRLRDGSEAGNIPAGGLYWWHGRGLFDIVQYRIART
jgi:hypothetical protein